MFIAGWAMSLFGAPLLRQAALYGAIGLAGVIFVAYMRYSAAAPYRAQIAALHAAVAAQERIINDHNSLMEEHERQADRLRGQVEGFVHAATKDQSACALSTAQLISLRRLAGY